MRKEPAESNPVSIGPARAEEAEAIAALIRRAFAQYRGRLQPEPSALRESTDSIRSVLETESVVVARRAGRVIGCVSVQQRPDIVFARRLAVEPGERGAGVGRALVAEAEEVARRLGISRLGVETRLALTENRAFFQALGFVERAQHCHAGFAYPTYVELQKTLI